MSNRLAPVIAVVAILTSAAATAAQASPAGDPLAGRAIAARLAAGSATCRTLSTADFRNLGDHLMGRIVGSGPADEAMDSRMRLMIGSRNADLMYQALGRSYAGCRTGGEVGDGDGAGMIGTGYGLGMMGGSAARSGWEAMSGPGYAWMRNGDWRYMDRAGWRRAARGIIGPQMMGFDEQGGLSTAAVLGILAGAPLVAGLAVYLLRRRPWRHRPANPSAA